MNTAGRGGGTAVLTCGEGTEPGRIDTAADVLAEARGSRVNNNPPFCIIFLSLRLPLSTATQKQNHPPLGPAELWDKISTGPGDLFL